MPMFDERIKAALAALKARIRGTPSGPQHDSDPVSALHEAAQALEADLAAVEARLATKRERTSAAEARAISAIRARDDAAAREALLEQQALVEACHELQADAEVLHAMLAECRTVLGQNSE